MNAGSLATIVATVALVGCAAKPLIWDKSGGTQSEFDADQSFCQYDVQKATQGTDPTLRTVFGQELDRAMRQRDLMLSCMRMKGYTLRQ